MLMQDAPKVFHALGRFLSSEDLALVVSDYALAASHGGNTEPFHEREVGVSFNPRLARLLSILINDIGWRELVAIRALLFGALVDIGIMQQAAGLPGDVVSGLVAAPELKTLVTEVASVSHENPQIAVIRGIIALDAVRHLHQTSLSIVERKKTLEHARAILLEVSVAGIPEMLPLKLNHAIGLQERNLEQS